MSTSHIKTRIENQSTKKVRIGAELATIPAFLCRKGYVKGGPKIKTADLEAQCQEADYGRVERLVDLGLVEKIREGPDTYIIHERTGDIVNGQGVFQMVNEELRRVAAHVNSDPQIRAVVANARGVTRSQATVDLFKGDFATCRSRLEHIVRAIQYHTTVQAGDYGAIVFRTSPNYYRATPLAVSLYNK